MRGVPRTEDRSRLHKHRGMAKINIPVAHNITITDPNPGIGYGSVNLRTMPKGNFVICGGVAYIQFSSASAGLINAFEGDFGVGRALLSSGALTQNQQEFINGTPFGPATNKTTPVTRGISDQANMGRAIDNTGGGANIYLNVLIDDTSISAGSVITARGHVQLCYILFN